MHIYRADGDRLAELWAVRDEHSGLVQVGALPAAQLPPSWPEPGLGRSGEPGTQPYQDACPGARTGAAVVPCRRNYA